jgi:hypothetical protein
MSILAYPRIHFKGKCEINPATGNNNDVMVNIDSVNVGLGAYLSSLSDDEARAWMMAGMQARHPRNKQLHWYLKSGWNYFGDMSFRFVDVAVTTVTGTDGKTGARDPIVGQTVAILGSAEEEHFREPPPAVICDLDPLGSALTQLFIGRLTLGGKALGLEATYDTRAFGRWILWRNATIYQGEQNYPGAGATWQFAIPSEELTFHGTSTSPGLAALRAAALAAEGIVVQFALYQPEPLISDEELIAMFRRHEYRANPVVSLIVGTVGVWEEGELRTAPPDRLLVAPRPIMIGPATARVQRDRYVVSLNLVSTFPEADFIRPPSKYDFGRVRLGLVAPSGGPPVPISDPIAYDYPTYESTGGVLDVPYDPSVVSRDQLDDGTLVLCCDSDGSTPPDTILSEPNPPMTVETDDRGVYLDVGESDYLSILVRERGEPPRTDVTVYIWEYQYKMDPVGDLERAGATLRLVDSHSGLAPRVGFPATVVYPRDRAVPLPIPVIALRSGSVALAFTLNGRPLHPGNPWDSAEYAGVRVMPQDDFSSEIQQGGATWDLVYEKIWRFYHVVYPAMSKVISLNIKETMEKNAPLIVAATDPDHWESTHYMPPTRDLSTGKRALLVEWANEVARKPRGGSN